MGNEMIGKESLVQTGETKLAAGKDEYFNVLRRHIKENPGKAVLARHRLWMDSIRHEYPLPYVPFRIRKQIWAYP